MANITPGPNPILHNGTALNISTFATVANTRTIFKIADGEIKGSYDPAELAFNNISQLEPGATYFIDAKQAYPLSAAIPPLPVTVASDKAVVLSGGTLIRTAVGFGFSSTGNGQISFYRNTDTASPWFSGNEPGVTFKVLAATNQLARGGATNTIQTFTSGQGAYSETPLTQAAYDAL